jgi:aminocarboxymuconate-semialdehyde decarboxylase
MRIDAHTHAQPPDYVQALLDSGRYEVARGAEDQLIITEKGARLLTVAPRTLPTDQRIAEMDAAGIDAQILSLATPNVYFLAGQPAVDLAMRCNDYLAGIVREHPARFRALASVPLTADVDSAIREYERCLDELGMTGVLIGANIDGTPIDDQRFDPFYEELNRRGTPLFIHPMAPPGIEVMNQYALAPLVGFMFDTTLAVSRLIFSNFFGRFLGINVLVGDLGGAIPYLARRLDLGYRTYPECQEINRPPSEVMERLYLDTGSCYEPTLRYAIETVGEDHLVFGSDYPQVVSDVSNAITSVESAVARRHRGKIMGENAARLFGLSG